MRISFTEHPAAVGETYFGHLASALCFSGKMAMALMVCLIHAFLPFLFEKTGSRMVMELVDGMVHNRDKRPQATIDAEAQETEAVS